MSSTTPNYGWILPGVSDPTDADLWGGYLNSNLSNQDTQVYAIQLNAMGSFVSIASAATVNIGSVASANVFITGTTTITAFDTAIEGTVRTLRFQGALTLTHNATSLILPSGANITTAANDIAVFKSLGGGNWICTQYQKANGQAVVAGQTAGRLIGTQFFTANGTYTPTSGMATCVVEVIGGGGGGGGSNGNGGAAAAASGGGSGRFARVSLTSAQVGVSQAVTIGTAGAGGTAGANNGTAGGSTSLGTLIVCPGGNPGLGAAAATTASAPAIASAYSGSASAQITTADFGRVGVRVDASTTHEGKGGDGGQGFNGQGAGLGNYNAAGGAATSYGSGGGGAGGNVVAAGGAGSAGYMIIYEYS